MIGLCVGFAFLAGVFVGVAGLIAAIFIWPEPEGEP